MFKFSLVSDLHLDHPQPKTPPMEENILVAGDCGNGLIGLKYLNKLKRKGHKVWACTGNHEHYGNVAQGRTVEETEKAFHEGLGQIQFAPVYLGDKLWLVMANGWYQVPQWDEEHWRGYMSDSSRIGIDAAKVTALASIDAGVLDTWLNAISWREGRAIVMTHTAPCTASLDPRFEGHESNRYYWNPMMTPLLAKYQRTIALWCHGHTHAAVDVEYNGVRIVTNPRGYPSENPTWQPLTLQV